MIMKFMDWCDRQESPTGVLCFVGIGTIACCTGLVFVALLADMLSSGPSAPDPRPYSDRIDGLGLVCGIAFVAVLVVLIILLAVGP